MHSLVLVTIELPTIESEPDKDMEVEQIIKELEKLPDDNKHVFEHVYLSRLRGLDNAFARYLDNSVADLLAPYSETTDDPEYLEFSDWTDVLKKEYENRRTDCFKLPDGSVVSMADSRVCCKYTIGDDGKVYQTGFGQLKTLKRSKSAKKMVGLKGHPYNKLYKTFEEYVESRYCYHEQSGRYGYYYNPNAFYDWYELGGRWPFLFLVKDSCKEFSKGSYSCGIDKERDAPEGYKWVCAARKKDIEWDMMNDWQLVEAENRLKELETWFKSGECPKNSYGKITDEGIENYHGLIYKKGEKLDEYIARMGITQDLKYPVDVYACLHDGEYLESESLIKVDGEFKISNYPDWTEHVQNLIDDLNDDVVLVGVDCHV